MFYANNLRDARGLQPECRGRLLIDDGVPPTRALNVVMQQPSCMHQYEGIVTMPMGKYSKNMHVFLKFVTTTFVSHNGTKPLSSQEIVVGGVVVVFAGMLL